MLRTKDSQQVSKQSMTKIAFVLTHVMKDINQRDGIMTPGGVGCLALI